VFMCFVCCITLQVASWCCVCRPHCGWSRFSTIIM